MVNEFLLSFKKQAEDKLENPFWGAFIISWLAWNWKVWYVTFFIDSELLFQQEYILKIDYISRIYRWESLENFLLSVAHLFIFPYLSVCFFVYIFSKVTSKFYRKSKENENSLYLINLEMESKKLEKENAKLEIEQNVIHARDRVRSEKTKEEKWDEEYDKFKKTIYYPQFGIVKNSYYKNKSTSGMSSDMKAYFDSNGIIEIVIKGFNEQIELTEKGKYFVKKYTEEKGSLIVDNNQ